jgi:hypothetical protein
MAGLTNGVSASIWRLRNLAGVCSVINDGWRGGEIGWRISLSTRRRNEIFCPIPYQLAIRSNGWQPHPAALSVAQSK